MTLNIKDQFISALAERFIQEIGNAWDIRQVQRSRSVCDTKQQVKDVRKHRTPNRELQTELDKPENIEALERIVTTDR